MAAYYTLGQIRDYEWSPKGDFLAFSSALPRMRRLSGPVLSRPSADFGRKGIRERQWRQ